MVDIESENEDKSEHGEGDALLMLAMISVPSCAYTIVDNNPNLYICFPRGRYPVVFPKLACAGPYIYEGWFGAHSPSQPQ